MPHAERDERGEHKVDAHEEEQPDALQHARVEVNAGAAAAIVVVGGVSSGVRGDGVGVGGGIGGGRRHGGEYHRQLCEIEAGDRVPLRVHVEEGRAHLGASGCSVGASGCSVAASGCSVGASGRRGEAGQREPAARRRAWRQG